MKPAAEWKLPATVVSRADMAHLVRDVEQYNDALDNYMTRQRATQQATVPGLAIPAPSDTARSFFELNRVAFTTAPERQAVIKSLTALKNSVPLMHMTFASEPQREHVLQLVSWIRQELHPQAVVQTGVQPALVAGVYVRTPNHVYDLSLRAALKNGRSILKKEIGAFREV